MARARFLPVLLLFLVAALCSAQVDSPEDQKFTINGTVVNAITGEPIKRALVEVYAQQPRALMTDADGRFQFEALQRGAYSVQARKPGFFSESEVTQGRQNNPVLLGQSNHSVTIRLYPETMISGTIVDRDGLPVSQMSVRVLSRRIESGRARWIPMQQKSTDENGAYRISGLMPGSYTIVAGPYSFPLPLLENGKGRPEGFRETFYPSGNDLASAQKLRLTSGQKFEANFTLTPEPLYRVRGTISSGASSVNVSLMPASLGMFGNSISTMLEGNQFESEWTAPGNYRLVANGNDSTGHAVSGNVPLIVHQDVLNAHIALQPMLTIPIELERHPVSTRSADSLRGTLRVAANDRAQIGYIQIRAKDSWISGSTMSGAIAPDTVLPNVTPGRYDVQVTMNPPWYAESVTRDDTDLLTQDLVVVPGGEQQPIRVVARDDSAQIKVQLQAAPKTVVTLLIVPDQKDSGQIREVQISVTLDNLLPPLRPREYTLVALDDTADLEYTNPEVLAPFLSRGTHVTLNPDETTTVKLEIIRRRAE